MTDRQQVELYGICGCGAPRRLTIAHRVVEGKLEVETGMICSNGHTYMRYGGWTEGPPPADFLPEHLRAPSDA